jgi:cytochrome c oxidase subunit 2
MALYVFADPPDRFRAWLANMAAPARADRAGEQAFQANACGSCHAIRGTSARGIVGPDLTHVASRTTLAALAIPNRRGDLADWIRVPQLAKPGNRMPALGLGQNEVKALVAYLEGLK